MTGAVADREPGGEPGPESLSAEFAEGAAAAELPLATHGLRQQLVDLAAEKMLSFEGRNARASNSNTVHAVAPTAWLSDVQVPAALCHTSFFGGELARLEATSAPVNCVPCLRGLGVIEDNVKRQPVLAGLDELLVAQDVQDASAPAPEDDPVRGRGGEAAGSVVDRDGQPDGDAVDGGAGAPKQVVA